MAHEDACRLPVALPGVKKIVAIGPGKGGVGKTTRAVVNPGDCTQQTGPSRGADRRRHLRAERAADDGA